MSETLLVKRPVVARPPRPTSVAGIGITLALLGVGVFSWLSEARAAQDDSDRLPPLAAVTSPGAPQLMVQAAAPAAPAAPSHFVPTPSAVTLAASTATQPTPYVPPSVYTTTAQSTVPVAPVDALADRARAPSLVVDLAQADPARQPGSDGARLPPPMINRNLSETEQFSSRVGNEGVEVARASRMTGLDRLVPQGAVIGAVMETALNSDLPGFARATVQRDVYSFDGSAVLIPAGSRVIGQYKSGIAQGASRIFVLWTRLIRPDGVSIELASPATDELGRGGIGGKVNRHFLQRFGGAILTSVLSAGISAAAASASGGSTIIVGSAGEASSLAGQATRSADIPPTITTRQGANVRIFVARDLDFSQVGPTR